MRRLAIGLTALALTGITACGSGQTAQSNDPTGEDSPEQSEQELNPLSSTSALGDAVSEAMRETSTVKVSMRAENYPVSTAEMVNYDCEMELIGPRMHCSGLLDFILDSGEFYMKPPERMREQRGITEPWVKLPAGKLGQSSTDFSQLSKFGDIERMLPEGSTIGEKRKTELDGRQVVRYDVTVDMNVTLEKGEQQYRQRAQRMLDRGVEELEYVFWVDERGLPMRITSETPDIAGIPPDARMVITYSDWGEPVDITVPPAEKIDEQYTQDPV